MELDQAIEAMRRRGIIVRPCWIEGVGDAYLVQGPHSHAPEVCLVADIIEGERRRNSFMAAHSHASNGQPG